MYVYVYNNFINFTRKLIHACVHMYVRDIFVYTCTGNEHPQTLWLAIHIGIGFKNHMTSAVK